MAARGREVAGEAEGIERLEIAGRDLGGRSAAEKFAEKHDEAAHEGRFGVAAEKAAAVGVAFADEPDDGDATADALRISSLGGGERRSFSGAIDHGGEAVLGVVEDREIVEEALQFPGEEHGENVWAAEGAASLRRRPRNTAHTRTSGAEQMRR